MKTIGYFAYATLAAAAAYTVWHLVVFHLIGGVH